MKSQPDKLILGQIVGTGHELAMNDAQRSTHMHVIGATGSGKSKALEHQIRQDIRENRGLCLIDPHGTLAANLLAWISREFYPPRRFFYIAPHRDDWTVCYNPLHRKAPDDWFLVNALKIAVVKCWGADNTHDTPRLDEWLKTAFYTAIKLGLTLPEVGMLLEPGVHRNIQRRAIIGKLPESQTRIRDAWEQLCYLSEKKPVDFEQTVGSTTRRLSAFLDNPRLNRIFGVPDVSLDLAGAMDEGAVILVDLSTQGRLHPEDAKLFGTLLLTDFYVQMFARQEPERPFTLYVDEFQNYATKDIARMLDEARKFGLRLVLAHQRPGQLMNSDSAEDRDIWSAVMTNCRSKMVFGGIAPDELEPIARMLSMGVLDPMKVKREIRTRSVLDYRKEYWQSHTESETHGSSYSSGAMTGSSQASGMSTSGGSGVGYAYAPGSGMLQSPAMHLQETKGWASHFGSASSRSDFESEGGMDAHSSSTTTAPVLVPVMGEQLSAIYYETLDEQLYQFIAVVMQQQQRQAMVRIVGQNEAIPIRIPHVTDVDAIEEDIEHQLALAYQGSDCYLPVEKATELVSARQKSFLALGTLETAPRRPPEPCATMEAPPSMEHIPSSQQPIKVQGVLLQERDFALLRDVFENRFISIKHAAALHWPGLSAGDAAAKRRLAKLAEAGLLQQQQVEIEGCRVIYRLTKESVDLLAERELIPRIVRTDWSDKMRKRYTDEIRPSHLAHELSLYDLKVAFTSAVNQHAHLRIGELGIWPLPYAFPVTRKGRVTKQLPDGFLRIDEHRPSDDSVPVSHYFYLELDNGGNEKLDTLAEKAEGYRSHLRSGAFATALGVDTNATFRVLVVVAAQASAARRDNICARIGTLGIHTLVWAATMQEALAGPLESVWITPKALADAPDAPIKLPLLDGLNGLRPSG